MILGNKCDMEDKRQVAREKGDSVSGGCCGGSGLTLIYVKREIYIHAHVDLQKREAIVQNWSNNKHSTKEYWVV